MTMFHGSERMQFRKQYAAAACRPEFQYRRNHLRLNPVTRESEPYLPWREKLWRLSWSGVSVLFFVSMRRLQQTCAT